MGKLNTHESQNIAKRAMQSNQKEWKMSGQEKPFQMSLSLIRKSGSK